MSKSTIPILILHPRGVKRIRSAFPWLYPQDVVRIPDGTGPGVVGLVDGSSRWMGQGLYSPDSKLMVRVLTHSRRTVDSTFIEERVAAAIRLRDEVLGYGGRSCRLIHGEADGLPGVVVDRIGRALSVQFLTAGSEAISQWVLDALEKQLSPEVMILKNTARARLNEGLDTFQKLLTGESSKVRYSEAGIVFEVDLLEGQKTGVFLDQADNHALMGRLGRGRALDLFSYQGGFGLAMAKGGCDVTCVDSSDAAISTLTQAARINGLTVKAIKSDVMEFLRSTEELYDTIVCDPPAFAKKRSHVPRAMHGYAKLASSVLDHLAPGGLAMFCSCSSHVSADDLLEAIRQGAGSRRLSVLMRTGAGPDHPSIPAVPQSEYLKCFVVRILDT